MDQLKELSTRRSLNRRKFLGAIGAAGAATALAGCGSNNTQIAPTPTPTPTAVTDADILNFALNLEYLEAEFYLRAATGSGLASADIGSSPGAVTGGVQIPGINSAQQNILNEIAYDEQQHVRFLRAALTGAGATPVSRPAIDLTASFNALAAAAGIGPSFNPFKDFNSFLVGAFVFEDVGVTAYSGAAPLISDAGIKAGFLAAAAGILAVEAYHAAYVRTTLTAQATALGTTTYPYLTYANQVAALRATLGGSNETTLVVPSGSSTATAVVTPSRGGRGHQRERHCLCPKHRSGVAHRLWHPLQHCGRYGSCGRGREGRILPERAQRQHLHHPELGSSYPKGQSMPSQETQILDRIIASRRELLMSGGAAALAFALPKAAHAAATVSTYTDADILNFALNLEYLEANFYYLAAFGTNISTTNPLYPNGAMVQGITGVGTQGTVTAKANPKVNFSNTAIAGYAIETAIEEGKHVNFLRTALGAAAVAQPQIDLMTSFNQLAFGATITPSATTVFDPFANDATFLIGAYIFEDVGVTAYHGAAPLLTSTPTGKTYLAAAAGILAVEAYHAGMVRTTISAIDNGIAFPTIPAGTLTTYTQLISAFRAKLAAAAASATANPFDANPDDYGLAPVNVSLAGGTSVPRTQLVDADQTNVYAFSRTTTQVLNIVTGNNATTLGTPAKGVFFPNGLNGLFV